MPDTDADEKSLFDNCRGEERSSLIEAVDKYFAE